MNSPEKAPPPQLSKTFQEKYNRWHAPLRSASCVAPGRMQREQEEGSANVLVWRSIRIIAIRRNKKK